MRNREAARYARWSAIAAGAIALLVAGVYGERALQRARARRNAPAAVPITVQQQSAQFSFSEVEQDRTIFTIRASQATQYKNPNRAMLEDVWITVYGRDGSRNDNIHTRECSYTPETGDVRCAGEVQIDLENAGADPGKSTGPPRNSVEVKTSDLSFNRNTGEASTAAPVDFRFQAGQGRGVGIAYNTHDSTVRIEHGVEFDVAPSPQTGGLPVTATGSSLEIRRNERTVVLNGPVKIAEGARELSADTISVKLDSDFHARRAVAEGHPGLRSTEGGGKIAVSADRFEGLLDPSGWIDKVTADGGITGTRQTATGTDRFSAAHLEFAMVPGRNLVRDLTATGGVAAESDQGNDSRVLKTDAIRVTFSEGAEEDISKPSGARTMDRQRIETAETLSPATIESKNGSDTTTLRAKRFAARLSPGGHLDELLGHGGVEVRTQSGSGAPRTISAAELAATFGAHGEWNTLDERGSVRFQQADREASADHANIVRATDMITLEGSPVVSDSMSRTTAASVVVNQKSGELRATGGVASTYLPAAQGDAVSLGSGAAHISADALSGSVNSGHVAYAGHARLWQGDSVLDSDQIDLWRDTKKMQAAGHVVAVFPQASGGFAAMGGKSASSASGKSSGPTLWRVVAPVLTYWGDQGKAHMEGGVTARSNEGSLDSRTLDVFLDPAGAAPTGGPPHPPSRGSAAAPDANGGRQLSRVLAQGNVVVRQGDRRGMAEQAEYTAADGKFVLSGGQPTIADASSDTTTGRSLTFFVASDTILIDSEEGSRTLTKHRVEK
ncbi:MAG TPA: LPS export ABC transporter periplasmic protein LptC [Candidatus Acidoferrales bacterium]|nr:LPS export ABC transporter periplasmic protein LptC [Candidatus Acidoferrales bacterium]